MDSSFKNRDDLVAAADGAMLVGANAWLARGKLLPSAEIHVYYDRIVLREKWPHREFDFPRKSISGIQREGIFSDGFRIVHTCKDCPPCVVFYPIGATELLAWGLERGGYKIDNPQWIHTFDGFRTRLSLSAVIGPVLAGVAAFLIALLFKTRSLPFLQSPTIRSAGRVVSTAELSDSFAIRFAVAGAALLLLSAIVLFIQLARSNKSSGSGHSRKGG